MKDLDIGLLVLNAGVGNSGHFLTVEPKQLQDMLDINCYHVGALIQKMLPMLSNRGRGTKKSGIITVSSLAAQGPLGAKITYSATKVFVKYLC